MNQSTTGPKLENPVMPAVRLTTALIILAALVTAGLAVIMGWVTVIVPGEPSFVVAIASILFLGGVIGLVRKVRAARSPGPTGQSGGGSTASLKD